MRCWRLDDGAQTLVLASRDDRLPECVYWGDPLSSIENLETITSAHRNDVTGGMLDAPPDLSICPEASQTFAGQVGLRLRSDTGTEVFPSLRFQSAEQSDDTLTLTYADSTIGLTYTAQFKTDTHSHLIRATAAIKTTEPHFLEWLAAPVLPASQSSVEMIEYSGRWCREFIEKRQPWSAGARLRESRTGRTGHENFPGLIVPDAGATHTKGCSQSFHYGWSGGHRMVAEELPDGRRQIQFSHTAGSHLSALTEFETAPLYLCHSSLGMNGCAIANQRHIRDRIVAHTSPRPVHYNCWESIYFDHDVEVLKDIADRAAALGAERFVLDDGWFGQRDDDTSSLGDWVIDPRKYPDGLTPLIDHIRGLGMTFGIWFEPEMVNPNSDLYRAHPEWALGPADQTLGRQQMVLDMANSDVLDYLFDHIAAMLSDHEVDYIKWDHNRVLPQPDAAQTLGTYALLDRLKAGFPNVEIESCSSGGGRIDAGILERTGRVWLSDSNDARERLSIQNAAAQFLPANITGSHVGPRHCHTSGRTHDISFRAWVAAQRQMGFEMDPRELTQDEADTLKRVTTWWKDNRDWMMGADIHRLDAIDPAMIAEQHLAADASRLVVFAGFGHTSHQITPRPLKLTALDQTALYAITLTNADQAHQLSRGTPALKTETLTLSGQHLMTQGLTLPWSFPDRMWVIEGLKQ